MLYNNIYIFFSRVSSLWYIQKIRTMPTLRRYCVKNVLCNPNIHWSCWVTAVTAMERKGKGTNLSKYTRNPLDMPSSRRLLCHWCCLTVLRTWCIPSVSLVLPQFFPFHSPPLSSHSSDMKSSFIVNTNKLFLFILLHGSSCDSCSIKWLWQQQQQHKQLTCIINSIQAATQKVKGKEAHQPLQNPDNCLPPPLQRKWLRGDFFFRLKRRKLKSKCFILLVENEFLTLHWNKWTVFGSQPYRA